MRPGSTRRRNHGLWIGPLVTLAAALSYFMVFARYPALRDFPWLNLPLTLVGLAVTGLALWRAFSRDAPLAGKILGPLSFVFSAGLCALFAFYIFDLSYRLPAPTALTRGLDVAPTFTLVDQAGRAVRLEDFRGRKVVLTFYRGHW